MDGVETGVLLSVFAQKLGRKNEEVPDFYFTLLNAAGLTPYMVLNQKAKTKERRNWVHFDVWTSETAMIVHAGWCCVWVFAHVVESQQSTSIKGETIFAIEDFVHKNYLGHVEIQEKEGFC